MSRILVLVVALAGWSGALAAPVLRDDVLIVVNDNSRDSPLVGAYYAEKRGIDPANIVHVRVPAGYFISWDEFRSLRDQLIHFMQQNTLDDTAPAPLVCTDGEPPFYCPAATEQLRIHGKIRYVVTTRGVPTRMTVDGSALFSPGTPTSVDNYLKYWLINYFADDVPLAFTEREVAFGDGRGMRPVLPATDRELIVGRIDGLDLAAARALVDRAMAVEGAGIYGTWYGSTKFFHWRDANTGAAIYPRSDSTLLGWRYALGLWGEDRPECSDYLNFSGALSEGKAPAHCRVKFNDNPDPAAQTTQGVSYPAPGNAGSREPQVVDALGYQGWLDGQSAVGSFTSLLNWRKDDQCTVTLCDNAADPAACRAASTDSLRELNTGCVGVADGFIGYNHQSYPVSYLAVWPTGWRGPGNGDQDRLGFPEVRTDSGSDDSFSLWFRNTDQVATPRCNPTSDFTLPASAPCQDTRQLLLNQTIPLGNTPFDANNPPTYQVSLQYETRNINQSTPLRVRLIVHETGVGDTLIDYGPKTLATLAPGDTNWTPATVQFPLDPLLQTGASYDRIQLVFDTAGTFSGELGIDTVSVGEISAGVELAINGSFTEGHRQVTAGDHAATFLNRLNGVAFWGSVSHHQSAGCAFCFNALETLVYFLRGLPLGDAVWFYESNNSGILYGDPLYSPVAVWLKPVNDTDTLRGVVELSGSTVNGRDAAQVSTSYSIDVCAGDDFLVCDQVPGAWQSTGINGVGGRENMLLGDWDSSGVVPGSYTLRLSVTSLNTLTGRSQTLNDFYPVLVEVVIAPPPATASVQFSAADFRVAEDAAIVTVTRTGGIVDTVSVDYATADGTATAGNDYMATSGTLNFAAGVTSQSFNVVILDDTAFDGDETVNLTLRNVSGGELGNPVNAVLTITENDPNPQDSNGDGISDVDAAALGLDPNAPNGDTDGDGISDVNEVGGNITEPLDGDVDGVIDALEADIAAGVPLDGGVSATITTAAGETLTRVSSQAAIGGPAGFNFPFGAISYTTTSPVGGDVTVRMRFSTDLPANLLLFKVDNAGGFTELANTVWTLFDPRTIEVTLTDGDHATDLDGTANGSIDDPVAIAVGNSAAPVGSTVSEGNSGGGGGCMLKPAADKDITFPMFLLASLGYLYRRRRY